MNKCCTASLTVILGRAGKMYLCIGFYFIEFLWYPFRDALIFVIMAV